MPNRRLSARITLAFVALVSLACNLERVLNPALPTHTPSPLPEGLADPSATPPPTPIATPEPGRRVEAGDQALFYGDWDQALHHYQTALEQNSDPEIQSAAWLGIARARFASGDPQAALDAVNALLAQFPDSPQRGLAFFLAGEAYSAIGRHREAALAYGEYLAARPGLAEVYVYERLGDALSAAGGHQEAIEAYLRALQSPHIGDRTDLNVKIGDAYLSLGDPATALVTYQDVIAQTGNDYRKAAMLYKIGSVLLAQGDAAGGYAAFHQAVQDYPLAYDSYLALVALVEGGQPVDEFQRGLVDYFAGQYGLAIAAFDRFLQQNPDAHDDRAHHYIGLSYQALGQYAEAIAEWEELLRDHPGGEFSDDAVDEIAYTQWVWLEDFEDAIQTYTEFVDAIPDHPRAAEFLFYAGRTAERNNDLRQAASLWQRLGSRYSATEYGPEGFFQAGFALLRLRDFPAAQAAFQGALSIASDRETQARAYFWMGKAFAASGNPAEAQSMWSQARTLDPTGYYSERAAQLLAGQSHFGLPAPAFPAINLEAERHDAENWLRVTFNLPADLDLSAPGPLAGDLRFQRGTELWRLGLYEQARLEFESLRQDIAADPANTYRLANHLIDLGLYRSGIIAARQVLNLVGYDDAGTLNAPIYFNRLRFGLYFREVVEPAAAAYGFESLFLYSLIRQESLFEGFVTSAAGARGLMQIIPSTGQSIFDRSGWPAGYTSDDLYRPVVSITYGADYLSRQRAAVEGDLLAALAAYNGGPGNAAAWRRLAAGDPDLFIEVIRFEETRNYIRSIFEQYVIYNRLYGGN
jgi:soluble lytic murein transglycosylase